MQAELESNGHMNDTRPRILQRLRGQEEEEEMYPQRTSLHFQHRRTSVPQKLQLLRLNLDCHRQLRRR